MKFKKAKKPRTQSIRTSSSVSTTLSRRSTGIRQGKIFNEGTAGQYSMYKSVRGKSYLPKHVEDALAPQSVQNNGAAQLKSPVGKQAVATAFNLWTPPLATNFTGDKITRVLYDTARGDVTINNIYLSNCYMIIYDVIARKDAGQSTIGDPATCWTQGATDESNATAPTIIGSTPWASELFNQFYKVVQVTNVLLSAGGTHVHKVKITPKKVVSAAYAQYSTYGFQDITYWCMIEIHGAPANDVTTQTQVGVGAGGINYILDTEQVIKQLQTAKPTITLGNTLISAFTVGEQVVNLGGSTIVPQAEG